MSWVWALARTLACWTFGAVALSGFVSVHLLTLRRLPDAWVTGFLRWFGRSALALAGVELVVENASTLEGASPRVFICNHQSGLDLIWGAAVSAPRTLLIAKKEIAYVPVLNLAFWGLRFVRIDRSDGAGAIRALARVAEQVVAEKRTLNIGPEGTRTRDGRIGPFKKGAFHLARQQGIPLHPLVVQGAFECLPRGAFVIRPGRIRVRFLPPVDTRGWREEELEAKLAELRARMVETYVELGGPR